MSLPPGFLDELRTRLTLSQVVGRKVMWDKRKSNQGKGDFWAPCPFHHEKTASFHVDDRKGFYYCFGCHAKGDVIGFVKDTENVSFMEAIELLAREAGMSVPRPDPKSQERTDKRAELADVMEEAVKYFRMSLKTGAAAAARDYLNRRGLKQEGQDRFEIGFAPNDRKGLFAALTGRGISAQHLIDSGMCIKPDDGGEPYDRFRGRIMFPIRDARGRCIAFGGRAMDPNARAKYLNSPETILFDKGRSLYHHGPARAAVGRGQPLIVAEGYMDVIALALGGFEGSVAPLGTAITEHQLNLMWQISPEPIIALDGDKAGLRAAYRLIDVALPMLQTGRALRFALMPQGQDPDDLIRAKGPQAVQDVLDNALSLVELMWQRETEGQNFDSPDRRASLDKRLRDALMQITDKSLRSHYGQAMRDLRWDLFRPKRSGKKPWSAQTKQRAHATTRASVLVQSDGDISQTLREAVIVAVVLKTPQVIERFYDDLVMLELGDRTTAEILGLLLELRPTSMDDAIAQLSSEIPIDTLERFMRQSHLSVIPSCKKPGNIDLASMTLQEELVKLAAHKGLLAELNEAFEIPDDDLDDTVLWRLGQAADAQNRAARPDKDDVGQFDMGENGARINRDERSKLDALIQTIRYDKRKK
jgi:DNA primase